MVMCVVCVCVLSTMTMMAAPNKRRTNGQQATGKRGQVCWSILIRRKAGRRRVNIEHECEWLLLSFYLASYRCCCYRAAVLSPCPPSRAVHLVHLVCMYSIGGDVHLRVCGSTGEMSGGSWCRFLPFSFSATLPRTHCRTACCERCYRFCLPARTHARTRTAARTHASSMLFLNLFHLLRTRRCCRRSS